MCSGIIRIFEMRFLFIGIGTLLFMFSCKSTSQIVEGASIDQEYIEIQVPLKNRQNGKLDIWKNENGTPLAWSQITKDSVYFGFFHQTATTTINSQRKTDLIHDQLREIGILICILIVILFIIYLLFRKLSNRRS